MVITEDEFLRWKEDDTTKSFFKGVFKVRETMKENLILGIYDNPEFVCGKASALQELIEMKYDDFQEAMRND